MFINLYLLLCKFVGLSMKVNHTVIIHILIGLVVVWMAIAGPRHAFAQASSGDCIGAIPVCQISYDVPVLNVPADNITNEINGMLSCLATGEESGVWYTFTVQSNGILHFNIIPYNANDDYDWALFDLTNAECEDIRNIAALEISCNYSSSTSNGGVTGANGGPNPQDEPTIPVSAGQRFVLYISNFTQSDDGYRLDFSSSTAQVPDNVPPFMTLITPNQVCNATGITVRFSENITCSSVQPTDFTFTGPGGPYTITSASSSDCLAGASYSTEYFLAISPPLNSGGTFTLSIAGTVSDICGNVADSNTPNLNIDYNAMSLTITVQDADCGVDNGQATATVSGGLGPYTYLWNDPNQQTTATATDLARGTYQVTVTDAQGCKATATAVVSDPTSFTFQIFQQADTCSKGVGIVSVVINGTTPPYQYLFQDFQNTQSSGVSIYNSATGDSLLYIRVTDMMGCWLDATIWVSNLENDTLLAYFTTDSNIVNILFPYAHFFNASQYYQSYYWEINGDLFYNQHHIYYQFPAEGEYPVTITAIDANGCKDTYTATIYVIAEFSLFIPNAFTLNQDGINESFQVQGMGFDSNTFEMYIYDRWGRCIFESRNIQQGWDGTTGFTDPNKTQQGVYVYRIYVVDNFGIKHEFTGKVVLIK